LALSIVRMLLQAAPLVAGILVSLLGAIVLLGWSTHAWAIVKIRPWLPPMRPLAALGFVLCGIGLVGVRLRLRRTSLGAALGVVAISVAAVPLYFGLDPGPVPGERAVPGSAASIERVVEVSEGDAPEWRKPPVPAPDPRTPFGPNAAIAFLLAALAMLLVRRSVYLGATLGVGVLALGAVAMLGYAVDVGPAIGWGGHARMSAHTALGFAILGTGLVLLAFQREREMREERSWWRPVLVGMTAAAAGLLFWTALRSQERDTIRGMVDAAALGVRNDLETSAESIAIALARLAAHGMAVGWQSPEDWQRDARLTVGAFRGFESIEWIDSGFVPRVVAESEQAHRPVESAESEAIRRSVLERVRESGEPAIAGPFDLEGGGLCFRVIVPFRSEGRPEAYLAGVFSTRPALAGLARHVNAGYSIVVRCEGREVFRDGDPSPEVSPRWTRRLALRMPGAVPWDIAVSPRKETMATLATPLPTLALGSSLLIALLLTLTVRFGDMAALRARSLGEAVKVRTRELEQSMTHLQTEVGERRRSEAVLRRTQTLGRLVSAELDLEKVVQAVTDAATELTGARFGWLLYSVRDEGGGSETRRATSGDASILGSPGAATRLGSPRFDRALPIRIDDAAKDPRARALLPFDGGTPPFASYLAVPVVSRSGRVRGALQFAHPGLAVFGEREQEIAVSLAAQAAIAMDNAMLYEAERQASARALATNEAKDNFIHMLGHELRNPLGSIRTALQVLSAASRHAGRQLRPGNGRPRPAPTEEDGVRMRRIIDRQVDQLARLADDLLQVSQLSSAKLSLRPEFLDLADLLGESVESVRARFEGAGLDLAATIPDRPVMVWADPHRVRQVVANLLANARKFCDAGGRVQVELEADSATKEAVVAVSDTGCGIEPHDLDRVFEPFVQTERARDRATGGLGLGLPIVKGLIEAQGGSVTAASEGRDRGARFTFRLPLHDARVAASPAPPPQARSAARRILVIDDHHDSADALKRLLGLSGNEVEVAYDGSRGIELAQRFRPDVLICDIGLPGMDGFEVARRLGRDPGLAAMRLIALTGYGDEDTIRAAREAGFRHHLTKPVETEILERLLAECD
jgi:signal transduction histidine kinase